MWHALGSEMLAESSSREMRTMSSGKALKSNVLLPFADTLFVAINLHFPVMDSWPVCECWLEEAGG